MDTDINKSSWKPVYKSEFSMGQYDFERINGTLIKVDLYSAMVNSADTPQLELMQLYLAELINLYDNFRPIIAAKNFTDELDGSIKEAIKNKRIWENSKISGVQINKVRINKFVDLCRAIKTKLYDIKQKIGLGIIVKKAMDTKEKIKIGVHGYKDFEGLPEA